MKRQNRNAKTQTSVTSRESATKPQLPSPTREQIQKRAYEIYKARGGGSGQELDDWLQAEHELKAEIELSQANLTRGFEGK